MFCYKKIDENGELISLQSCFSDIKECDSDLVPISEAEFNNLTAEMTEKVDFTENVTPTYEELFAENEALEAENAALLYQVLTGEEFTDV